MTAAHVASDGRAVLGESPLWDDTAGLRWLDVYLTSPAWRFVCAAGACGPRPVMGLMAPSVDQVGRYFPITLACELPERVNLVSAATASHSG